MEDGIAGRGIWRGVGEEKRRDGEMGMEEYGACETEGFVEAYGAYEEGKGFGESHRIDGNFKGHGNGESDEEGEHGRRDDGEGEEEGRAQRTGTGEQQEEGSVHQNVTQQDEQDVQRVGIAGKRRKPGEEGLESGCEPVGGLRVCIGSEAKHVLERKTFPRALQAIAQRGKHIWVLLKGNDLEMDMFP